MANPQLTRSFIAEWTKRGFDPAGMTEGSRGYDGILTIAAAITKAGAADADKIRDALWGVQLTGLTGKIAFEKTGQAGKESAQSTPQVSLVRIEGGKIALVK
jgi:branched-chain amino acid transport system substrate-binding protein